MEQSEQSGGSSADKGGEERPVRWSVSVIIIHPANILTYPSSDDHARIQHGGQSMKTVR